MTRGHATPNLQFHRVGATFSCASCSPHSRESFSCSSGEVVGVDTYVSKSENSGIEEGFALREVQMDGKGAVQEFEKNTTGGSEALLQRRWAVPEERTGVCFILESGLNV